MRRRRPEKRSINPDPKFNDLQVSKFMNYLLVGGKKGIAEKILYDAFDIVKDKSPIYVICIGNTFPIQILVCLRPTISKRNGCINR